MIVEGILRGLVLFLYLYWVIDQLWGYEAVRERYEVLGVTLKEIQYGEAKIEEIDCYEGREEMVVIERDMFKDNFTTSTDIHTIRPKSINPVKKEPTVIITTLEGTEEETRKKLKTIEKVIKNTRLRPEKG